MPSDPTVSPIPDVDVSTLLSLLRGRFGKESFQLGQLEVIRRLMSGQSAVAVFPTGGGKSLCYQLPSQLLVGTTIVISPLIALMKDQCDSLQRCGIRAARIDSTMSASEVSQTMQDVRNGVAKILYVAPERFFNERFRAAICDLPISLFAVDEAHCISRWGHNFRPDYLRLAELAKVLGAKRVLALTATATPSVLDDICDAFDIEQENAIRTPFFRPNLQLRSQVVASDRRDDLLVKSIKARPTGATVVYVTLQKTAVSLAEYLTSTGLLARPYHAGLEDQVRADTQAWFHESNAGIVVATIAFGMGIDKPNIRYVYHYNPPASLEAYAQEIGRAGRDGKNAICELLFDPNDLVLLENFAIGDTPIRQAVGKLVDFIRGQSQTFHLSHYQLSAETDIRILVARTLLTYLELDGYITARSPRYETYKIRPLVSSRTMLSHFKDERRDFIDGLLGCLCKGRTWFLLNMAVAAKRLVCDREEIVKAIELLAEKGWLEIEVSNLVHGYCKNKPIVDSQSLANELHERLEQRERAEIARLDEVVDMVVSADCMAAKLSQYFGETLQVPCGHCSACTEQRSMTIAKSDRKGVGTSVLASVRSLTKKYPDQLGGPRERARFLCGLMSPGFTRGRLSREPSFGSCNEIPYAVVLAAMQSSNG